MRTAPQLILDRKNVEPAAGWRQSSSVTNASRRASSAESATSKATPTGVQDDPTTPGTLEGLDHRQAEEITVEHDGFVVALDGQGQPQVTNRALGHLAPLAATWSAAMPDDTPRL